MLLTNDSGGVHTVKARHSTVHDHHVGAESIGKHECLLAITSEADNFNVGVGVQQHTVGLTHDLMVIHHQNFDVLCRYRFGSHRGLLRHLVGE